MKPYLAKGHERPLTFLRYNREGDLLFSSAKDNHPTVWFSENGERLGTYEGHNGTVWSLDVTFDSKRLLTGSGDQTAKLWEVETGKCVFTFDFNSWGIARSVEFSLGDREALITTDAFMGTKPAIHLFRIAEDPEDQEEVPIESVTGPQGKISRAIWGPLNKNFICGGEDGVLRMYDTETCTLIHENPEAHEKLITCISLSPCGNYFITGSQDKTSKLFDIRTLECMKTYRTERPVNAASISPLFEHVILGGGQDAADVTVTSSRAGGFQSFLFHKLFEEELASVKGHFGPINAIAFAPDGRSFSSGGEEGYIRIHHFDGDYYELGRQSRIP